MLDFVVANCADAGVELSVDLNLALSKKGARHRAEIINAIFTVRNMAFDGDGTLLLPMIPLDDCEDLVPIKDIRKFQYFIREQIVAVGWAPVDTLMPPNNRDVLDSLRAEFDEAGIRFQINRGLMKGNSPEAGMYRLRMANALQQLNRHSVATAVGSEFAAAVAQKAPISDRIDADHPVYGDPDLLMAMIRDRGSVAQGNISPVEKTYG